MGDCLSEKSRSGRDARLTRPGSVTDAGQRSHLVTGSVPV